MHTRTAVGHFVAPQPWPGLPTLNAALKLTAFEQPIIPTALSFIGFRSFKILKYYSE